MALKIKTWSLRKKNDVLIKKKECSLVNSREENVISHKIDIKLNEILISTPSYIASDCALWSLARNSKHCLVDRFVCWSDRPYLCNFVSFALWFCGISVLYWSLPMSHDKKSHQAVYRKAQWSRKARRRWKSWLVTDGSTDVLTGAVLIPAARA